MPMSQAKIEGFQTSLKCTPPAALGIIQTVPLLSKVDFADIKNFKWVQGTYTPVNDYLYLWQNIPIAEAPNFAIIMVSGRINLTISANQTWMVNAMPLQKVWSLFLPKGSTYRIDGIYIEGRINVPDKMPQGTSIDYLACFGQALIA